MGSSDDDSELEAATEEAAPQGEAAQAEEAQEKEASAPKRKKKRAKKAEPPSFASYLATLFMAEKGFRPETVPEAEALARASDVVLTYSDGMTFSIVCIVDAEKRPEHRFDLSREALVDIGRACGKYTGSMNGAKLPVGIRIVEIRDGIREEDRLHLRRLRRLPGLAKVAVSAFILSPSTKEVWSNLMLGWLQERWFRAALSGPRRTQAELAAAATPAALAENVGPPWLTFGLLGLTAALFGAELAFGVGPTGGLLAPSIETLIALGGVSRPLVLDQGEWWRLFTASLLHADPIHLLLNGVGLYLGGAVLESLLGRAWLGALFVLGALGGALASIAINDPNVVSVGASGAIMGLLAAALVATQRLPAVQRAQAQMPLMRMLIPSLLPIALHRSEGHIDFAAHFGGAITGAAVGIALLRAWPAAEPHPRFRRPAALLAIAGAALYAFAFLQVRSGYAAYRDTVMVELIPDDRLGSLKAKDGDELLVKYPRDPRSHWIAAMALEQNGDLAAAEKHLRAALAEEGVLRRSFGNRKLEAAIRGALARVLEAGGRHAEALEAARPVCDLGTTELASYCR